MGEAGTVIGKLPPQAPDLEQVVLGAIMLESDRLSEVIGFLPVGVFYRPEHNTIYDAILQLFAAGQPVDIITVTEQLRSNGTLNQVGGSIYVTQLTNRIASSVNTEYHARLLIEAYYKREVIRCSTDAIEMAYDPSSDAFECIDTLEQSIIKINDITTASGSMKTAEAIMVDVIEQAHRREDMFKRGLCTGINTGLVQLNKLTGGWQNGDLIILAGRPSMGKTALMLHHAISSNVDCCIFSLEMSNTSLVNRMATSLCDIDADRFRRGAINVDDWNQIEVAQERIRSMRINIDENPICSTRYIKSKARVMRDKGKCDLVMVDYLQLLDMRSDQRGRNREQEVSQAAREMKIIAKSLGVPVILLSQLSRAVEGRQDKRPMLSDLRESGAIEQDADIVMFAYRPAYYNPDDEPGVGYEIVAKGRNIGIGEIPFAHNKSMTKIYDYEPSGMSADTLSRPNRGGNDDTPF